MHRIRPRTSVIGVGRLCFALAASRATDAWSATEFAKAGDELETAANEFELAADDARSPLDARGASAAADAHSVAARLQEHQAVSTDEFLRTVTALDEAVRKLGSQLRELVRVRS